MDEEKTVLINSTEISSSKHDTDSESFVSSRKGYSSISGLDDEFAGLSEADAEILRDQVTVPNVTASFLRLYRYATKRDKIMIAVGVVFSLVEGLTRPGTAFIFGSASEQFTLIRPDGEYYNSTSGNYYYYNETATKWYSYNDTEYGTNYTDYSSYMMNQMNAVSPDEFFRIIRLYSGIMAAVATLVWFLTYVKSYIFNASSEVLASRIKEHYLSAILRQNIGYFDKLGSGEITTRISSDTALVQDAMSEKVSYVISHLTTFVASIALAYYESPILTSIILGIVFAIIAVTYFGSMAVTIYSKRSQDAYGAAATLSEEAISSVRNIQAFNIQERMVMTYDKFLLVCEKWDIHAGYAGGLLGGGIHIFAYTIDTLTFWQGIRLYTEERITVAAMMTCLMTLFQGAFAFTIISPYLTSITTGVAASTKIFATIDRKSPIDSSAESGKRLESVRGEISIKDVRFIYPSRPNVTILNNFNLNVPAGKTVALVGASGSGKSTIIGILERFYNPLAGQILLDGHDIMDLNIRWLRQNIALVSQEPNLFAVSIFENIAYGLIGTKYEFVSKEEKTDLIIEACKQANAWDFIKSLPDGLETQVGERGFLMSGGQKQRIAIARAIVSDPKILLLDEATSALDTKSEGVVQEALDRASKNRTTIVIAHRLSTIKDADLIVVMRTGVILEQGTHNELLAAEGEYYNLVKSQSIAGAAESFKAAADEDGEEEVLDEKAGVEMVALKKTKTAVSSMSAYELEERPEEKLASIWEVSKVLYRIGRRDLIVTMIGLYSGALTGVALIGLAFIYAFFLLYLQRYTVPYDSEIIRQLIYPLAGFIFMTGCILFFTSTIGGGFFGYTSSRLVRKIREMSLRQMLRQDISYFDMNEHSVGFLTASLASDGQRIKALGGETANKMVESAVTMGAGLVIAIIVGYKLGLVMFATVPLILLVGYFRFRMLAAFTQKASKEAGASSDYACEAASAIKTVLSLTREEEIMERYRTSLARTIQENLKVGVRSALFDGLSRGMQFYLMALGFFYGGYLVSTGEYSVFQFYFIFILVVFAAESTTTVFTFAPEMAKALKAAREVKKLLESEPEIDANSTEGMVLEPEAVEGNIEFKDIHFRYPTRLDVPVLRGLNLSIKKGQFVALVGSSGCGKSTTIGLIESFYRPQKGVVTLDGHDISELNVAEYRSHIALVQQEPVLYAGSIRENVALGSTVEVTDEEIMEACKSANIHEFILSLPDGYDTLCGSKGALLSGGQKQRIAIARALIRNPKVLLLDEATSALDSESERVVQAALDKASKGRTTIAVAHRLSTIQNADCIYVFEGGRVLESGTHQELLANKGKYYDLVQLQALEAN
ncbi:P-loop containing nucleoside triphosphate hydrolase protein [Lipomyces oligophaga]|uniref:P-loop containing nucleoside triphosphate hydrolase protein n=1 Tax=Lipomyces oligophaga TaxID=45792 RepID=UPI0034CE5A96